MSCNKCAEQSQSLMSSAGVDSQGTHAIYGMNYKESQRTRCWKCATPLTNSRYVCGSCEYMSHNGQDLSSQQVMEALDEWPNRAEAEMFQALMNDAVDALHEGDYELAVRHLHRINPAYSPAALFVYEHLSNGIGRHHLDNDLYPTRSQQQQQDIDNALRPHLEEAYREIFGERSTIPDINTMKQEIDNFLSHQSYMSGRNNPLSNPLRNKTNFVENVLPILPPHVVKRLIDGVSTNTLSNSRLLDKVLRNGLKIARSVYKQPPPTTKEFPLYTSNKELQMAVQSYYSDGYAPPRPSKSDSDRIMEACRRLPTKMQESVAEYLLGQTDSPQVGVYTSSNEYVSPRPIHRDDGQSKGMLHDVIQQREKMVNHARLTMGYPALINRNGVENDHAYRRFLDTSYDRLLQAGYDPDIPDAPLESVARSINGLNSRSQRLILAGLYNHPIQEDSTGRIELPEIVAVVYKNELAQQLSRKAKIDVPADWSLEDIESAWDDHFEYNTGDETRFATSRRITLSSKHHGKERVLTRELFEHLPSSYQNEIWANIRLKRAKPRTTKPSKKNVTTSWSRKKGKKQEGKGKSKSGNAWEKWGQTAHYEGVVVKNPEGTNRVFMLAGIGDRAFTENDAAVHIGGTVLDEGQLREEYEAADVIYLPGGADIDPVMYGEEPHKNLGLTRAYRDERELLLAKWAMEDGKPMMGICRGHQIVTVAAGGTLHQDIDTQITDVNNHRNTNHKIQLDPDSRLARYYGKTEIEVNSFHHQATNHVPPGWKAVAWSEDGIIEAIEHEELPIISVQFHPEKMIDQPEHLGLFDAFMSGSYFSEDDSTD